MISCLCPTYRRPALVRQSIARFLAQDYVDKELIVLDDAGELPSSCDGAVQVISVARRFRSLAEKYNALAGLALGEALAVWEDDDDYLPWHLTAHAAALKVGHFSKPSRVLSNYPGYVVEEPAIGRFHGSIAFTREAFDAVGGWPITRRADFDQQLMHRLSEKFGIVDTCDLFPTSYMFAWRTDHYHGQCYVKDEADEEWYDRIPEVAEMDALRKVGPCNR